jgi:hypothetical protein
MVSQPPPTEVGSVLEILEASSRVAQLEPEIASRVAQLEAEIAQLKDALARRQQIGVATGLLAQRFAISPERAWSLLVRLSQNGHVKVRDIAQAIINAHCGQVGTAEAAILSAVESYLPDGVRLIGAVGDGRQPSSEIPR